jgi:Zn-dependent protease with chaperone function
MRPGFHSGFAVHGRSTLALVPVITPSIDKSIVEFVPKSGAHPALCKAQRKTVWWVYFSMTPNKEKADANRGGDDDPFSRLPLGADDATLGAWLHRELTARYANETEEWATGRVERVMARLNETRANCAVQGACPFALRAEVLWIGEPIAFASPGRYIYLSRELLQEFTGDEPVAFVLAHEAAHHDLGHVRRVSPTLKALKVVPGAMVAGLLVEAITRSLRAPAHETAADEYAAHLCVAAGYDTRKAVALFEALERYALNHRDIDGVFGSDSANSTLARIERIIAGWSRPHAPLRERRLALERLLQREYGL